MTETEQMAGSNPAPGQAAVRALPPQLTRGPLYDTRSRFEGDGVRYKAKLIGMDPVPDAEGGKMLLDSMMKLKGFEVAARKQGKHKIKIWLKISTSGLKILDERTGIVLHEHDRTRMSSVTKDKSDPRALAYIYKHEDNYILFYIKTATQADPIILDIMEVCQRVDKQEISHQPAETKVRHQQDISLVALNEGLASPVAGEALENVFSPPTDSSPGQTNQASSSNELMEIFSPPLKEPLTPNQIASFGHAEYPQPNLSTAQILSMFPTQPQGGAPYITPPLSPSAIPWGQGGLMGNQWPSVPGVQAGASPAVAAPPTAVLPQPGFMMMTGPASPPLISEYPHHLNSISMPVPEAPGAPALDNNLLL